MKKRHIPLALLTIQDKEERLKTKPSNREDANIQKKIKLSHRSLMVVMIQDVLNLVPSKGLERLYDFVISAHILFGTMQDKRFKTFLFEIYYGRINI